MALLKTQSDLVPTQSKSTGYWSWPLFISLFLITVGQSSMDLYLPSMPAMTSSLGVSSNLIQATMTAFLITYAASQLLYGPLIDRYGRRPMLIVGTVIYILGSAGCVLATNIQMLIAMRLLQGFGGGACSVLSRTILRDAFDGKALIQASAYNSIVWAVVPLVAPVMGGYVQHYLGWRFNFLALVLLGVVLLIFVLLFFRETQAQEHRQTLQLGAIINNYKTVLKHREFMGYGFCLVMMYGVIVAFSLVSPFLLQTRLGLSPVHYGWVVIIITSGYLCGSTISSVMASRVNANTTVMMALILMLVSSVIMLIFALAGVVNLWVIVVPMFFVLMGDSIIYPTATAGMILPFPQAAGIAGALSGFLIICGGSLISFFIVLLPENTQLPLATSIVGMVLIALGVYRRFVRGGAK